MERALGVIRERGPAEASDQAAYAGRIVMGLVAYGINPGSFGGHDYVEAIRRHYDPASRSYDPARRVYANALAVLGLGAAGLQASDETISFFRANECPSGGFGHDPGCPTGADVDTTVLVISFLLSQGVAHSDPVIERSVLFLRVAQKPDGGFGLTPAYPTNANSTGLVLSLLAAMKQSPSDWAKGEGKDPRSALLALQNADGGFRYVADRPGSNYYATVQAVIGLAGTPYPSPTLVPFEFSDTARETASIEPRPGITPRSPTLPSSAAHASEDTAPVTDARGSKVPRTIAVVFPDGSSQTLCVHVDDNATGLHALQAAGIPVTTKSYGGPLGDAVCTINGFGNESGMCPGGGGHWHYWTYVPEGGWRSSSTGPSTSFATRSLAQGWTWSDGREPIPPTPIDPQRACSPTHAAGQASGKPQSDQRPRRPEIAGVILAVTALGLIAKIRGGHDG